MTKRDERSLNHIYSKAVRFRHSLQYSEQMKALEEERDAATRTVNQYTELKVIPDTFERGIKDGTIMSADDSAIMLSLVEQIIVRDTEIEIEFKCGVTIRQEYVR